MHTLEQLIDENCDVTNAPLLRNHMTNRVLQMEVSKELRMLIESKQEDLMDAIEYEKEREKDDIVTEYQGELNALSDVPRMINDYLHGAPISQESRNFYYDMSSGSAVTQPE